MSQGSAWERLVRGTGSIWLSERYRTALPANIAATVMTLRSSDHYHAKQGRSTARVRFDTPHGTPLSVYLKRHEHLPWITRAAAFLNPSGRHLPAGAEWAHLECVRALGISVPEVVAVGEQIGPWGRLRGFLVGSGKESRSLSTRGSATKVSSWRASTTSSSFSGGAK